MVDNDNSRDSSLGDKQADEGLEPETAPTATEAVSPSHEQRSLDIGESGQFAPGGYYNQQGLTESERIDLDEYTATRTPDDDTKK